MADDDGRTMRQNLALPAELAVMLSLVVSTADVALANPVAPPFYHPRGSSG